MSASVFSMRISTALLIFAGLAAGQLAAAEGAGAPAQHRATYEVVNRTLTIEPEGVMHLSAAPDDGIAWLRGQKFTEGRITVEVRGRDVMQSSFVGVAFHGDGREYDAVYVRPFNFNAADAARAARSLQYMSVPANTWNVLREKFPGKYEAAVTPRPAADSWVRLTLEIKSRRLRIFVNDASAAALTVELLNDRLNGHVGLWVGNNSEGWFRNLKIEPIN